MAAIHPAWFHAKERGRAAHIPRSSSERLQLSSREKRRLQDERGEMQRETADLKKLAAFLAQGGESSGSDGAHRARQGQGQWACEGEEMLIEEPSKVFEIDGME